MAQISGKNVSFRQRGKDKTLYATAILPFKEEGQIRSRRIERSTGTSDRKQAEKFAAAMIAEAFEDLRRPETMAPVTERLFGHALGVYEQRTGQHRFLLPIFDAIGTLPLSEVTQETIDELAAKLYPGRTAATLNRQIYTPISAVLNAMASKTYTPPRIKRPKGHLAPSNFKRPPKDWFQRVLPECPPNLAAILLFCRLHRPRTSEACRITPADLDASNWRVTVRDTKTSQEIVLRLADAVIEQLERYPWRLGSYVFGFSSKSRLYPALRAACKRAGVPYHVPKDVGRHSFATGLLDEGRSLKMVKEAGRWRTIRVPDMIYGHLEANKVDDQAREMGDKWAAEQAGKGEVIEADFAANQAASKRKAT